MVQLKMRIIDKAIPLSN